jgi:hypothetical protein
MYYHVPSNDWQYQPAILHMFLVLKADLRMVLLKIPPTKHPCCNGWLAGGTADLQALYAHSGDSNLEPD